MDSQVFDAIVIGGGPGGSSASSYLARAGKSVLVLEKEIFPRFHIGESLLPYNAGIFEELGLEETLREQGFPIKYGAQFHIGNASKSLFFIFSNGKFTRHTHAFQVERSKFDQILLQHAEKLGAKVLQGWTVVKFSTASDHVMVHAQSNSGSAQLFKAKFLIDASGRGNFTGNHEGLRVVHPDLKKLAVFGHFSGVRVDEGSAAGDTVIVRLENKWFWLIPLGQDKVSVGCVLDQDEFAKCREAPGIIFERLWKSSEAMRKRMSNARLLNTIQTTADFSYYNKNYVGQRLIRVGDAAGFMDPIFSAGVYLAMYSGKMAAQVIIDSIAENSDGSTRLAKYEKRLRDAMSFYWKMVHKFYTTEFIEVFFEPREKFRLASAVNAALAGELEGGFKLRWRMELFFLIVRAQAKLHFLPRVNFS